MKNLMIVMFAALSLTAVTGCKKKGGAGDMMAKMADFKDDMCKCKDSACATKVSEAMQKWTADMSKDQKEAKPSEDDMKKSMELSKQLSDCMQKAMGGGAAGDMKGEAPAGDKPAGDMKAGNEAPAGTTAPTNGNSDMPKECNDYKDAIAKLAACDKMPQQARDALKQAYDQASSGWSNLPAEAKAGLATACKAGADAVMTSGKSVCGW